MAIFTIKTSNGFNTNDAFAFSNPKTIVKTTTSWVVKNTVTGEHQNWYGTGFTYDANNQITGGTATKLLIYDAENAVQATVQFPTAWNFATQGSPSSYAALLSGDDSIIGGAGNDVLNSGNGTSNDGVYVYNGHSYLLSDAGTWTTAQAQAQRLGGNLVTINNQAENDWLNSTFDKTKGFLWIGYTDQDKEGVWRWISGEDSTYTHWNAVEPNNSGGNEDYAHLHRYDDNTWNDISNYYQIYGIIEINSINSGNDTLEGGQGNDIYNVNSTGDMVIENQNAGIDAVRSAITYKLTDNVENLTLTGLEKLKGFGNDMDNIITGNSAANTLIGVAGDDTLNGGAGNDVLAGTVGNDVEKGEDGNDVLMGLSGNNTLEGGMGSDKLIAGKGYNVLTGGADADSFRFGSASHSTITDFVPADDTIKLENNFFTKLITPGTLAAANFVTAIAAVQADDFIVYNKTTGALFYDADGNGTGVAVQIALIGNHAALTAADFAII